MTILANLFFLPFWLVLFLINPIITQFTLIIFYFLFSNNFIKTWILQQDIITLAQARMLCNVAKPILRSVCILQHAFLRFSFSLAKNPETCSTVANSQSLWIWSFSTHVCSPSYEQTHLEMPGDKKDQKKKREAFNFKYFCLVIVTGL